jgi:NAD(P)-dependent dehydrogenase (short-subunit alcohol dehydrogenase family)
MVCPAPSIKQEFIVAGSMEGKVVLVTGGGRGVGRGIALDMARAGAAVVVNDLGGSISGAGGGDLSPAQEVVGEIKRLGGRAVADGHSVADWNGAHAMVQAAIDNFGRLDAVVNNAGILRDVLFHKMEEADFDAVIAVHLKGAFNVSRAAAPHFREQHSGAYVHMTSTSGLIGNFGQANYASAKLAVVALSKSIALDMRRFNVRSNAVAPFAWTRMVETIPANTPEQRKRVEGLKKLVPERIAPLVVALCSDAGAAFTGQIFGVRNNEIFLFSQPRPIRSAQADAGWTPDTIAERVFPMFQKDFYPLDRSGDVFTWDPV